jgi:hypothetical protein
MAKHGKGVLRLLVDFVLLCLVSLGVIGTVFKLLMPDGWLEVFIQEIWQFDAKLLLATPLFILAAFIFAKCWLRDIMVKSVLGDWIMYAWMTLGLYFSIKLLTTGSW